MIRWEGEQLVIKMQATRKFQGEEKKKFYLVLGKKKTNQQQQQQKKSPPTNQTQNPNTFKET